MTVYNFISLFLASVSILRAGRVNQTYPEKKDGYQVGSTHINATNVEVPAVLDNDYENVEGKFIILNFMI